MIGTSRRPEQYDEALHPQWSYRKIDRLKIHPLNEKLYGKETADPQLVESIQKNGVLNPIVVNARGVILSGTRRWLAAREAEFTHVPTILWRGDRFVLGDLLQPFGIDNDRAAERNALKESEAVPLSEEMFIIESNRQREKTPEQRAREFAELLRIESEIAKQRKLAAQNNNTGRAVKAILPEQVKGQARDKAATVVGLKPRTAEKLAKVVKAADEGNREAREQLDKVNAGEQSVSGAVREVHKPNQEDTDRHAAKRNQKMQRHASVRKIIEAGVSALQQAGEWNSQMQDALDWLREKAMPGVFTVSEK